MTRKKGNDKDYAEPYFSSGNLTVTNPDSILEKVEYGIQGILASLASLAQWLSKGSAWVIEEVPNHDLNIASYLPLKGKRYLQLPQELRNSRKGLINLKNDDDKCFQWCHVRALHPAKIHPERITVADWKYAKELDYSGVTFPVSVKDMDRIERQNLINISVFAYDEDTKIPHPIRVSKSKYDKRLNLLWIEGKDGVGHYVLIKDFDRFMTTYTKHKDKKHFCMLCLKCCSSARVLEMHQRDCIEINGVQAIKMPPEGSQIYFKNLQKMMPVPFVTVLCKRNANEMRRNSLFVHTNLRRKINELSREISLDSSRKISELRLFFAITKFEVANFRCSETKVSKFKV